MHDVPVFFDPLVVELVVARESGALYECLYTPAGREPAGLVAREGLLTVRNLTAADVVCRGGDLLLERVEAIFKCHPVAIRRIRGGDGVIVTWCGSRPVDSALVFWYGPPDRPPGVAWQSEGF